jgi:cobalt-zinc-cadmium efflux system outer membrane protein
LLSILWFRFRFVALMLALTSSFALVSPSFCQDVPASVAPVPGPASPSQFIPFGVPTATMPTLRGTDTPMLSLSASLDTSLVQSPRMSGVRALLGVAKAGYAQALTLPNPGIYIANNYRNSYLTGASIPIEPPWKLYFRLLIAKRQVEQTKLEIARTMWQFRGEVRKAYAAFVTSEELLNARLQVRDLSQKIWDASKTQYDQGSVPGLDVRRAKLAWIQARMDADAAQIQVNQAREQLDLIMGKSPDEPIQTPPLQPGEKGSELLPEQSKELPNRAQLVLRAKENRLELKIAKAAILTNEANLKNAYGNVIPTPRFVTGRVIEANPPTGPKTKAPFFQAYIDTPVLNFNQGDITKFKAIEKQLKLDFAGQNNQIEGQVSLAYHRVMAARQRLKTFTEEALPEADAVGNISKHGYELGQLDLNTLLDAQRANIQTKSQFFDAVLAYQIALNDLEQAIGVPL